MLAPTRRTAVLAIRRSRREGGRMDPMTTYAVITIAFLVLGILALAFGADSRDGFDDDWRR